jgi:hypothetical protein
MTRTTALSFRPKQSDASTPSTVRPALSFRPKQADASTPSTARPSIVIPPEASRCFYSFDGTPQHCHSARSKPMLLLLRRHTPALSFRPKQADASTPSTAHPSIVIPTEVSRRFFFSFAPAKESAYAAEESLFAVSALSSDILNQHVTPSNSPRPTTFKRRSFPETGMAVISQPSRKPPLNPLHRVCCFSP